MYVWMHVSLYACLMTASSIPRIASSVCMYVCMHACVHVCLYVMTTWASSVYICLCMLCSHQHAMVTHANQEHNRWFMHVSCFQDKIACTHPCTFTHGIVFFNKCFCKCMSLIKCVCPSLLCMHEDTCPNKFSLLMQGMDLYRTSVCTVCLCMNALYQ